VRSIIKNKKREKTKMKKVLYGNKTIFQSRDWAMINVIKLIREISGIGLKDAKDITDMLKQDGKVTVEWGRLVTAKHIRDLEHHGIKVRAYGIPLRTRTQQLLIAALKDNDRDLAKGLFQAWYDSK
jgi:hypothetical protein